MDGPANWSASPAFWVLVGFVVGLVVGFTISCDLTTISLMENGFGRQSYIRDFTHARTFR